MAKKLPVNKGGRPVKIKDNELQKLETAFKMGCNNSEACSYAELPESTFYDYIKKHPEFSDKIQRWKQNPVLKAKYTVYKNLDDTKTAQWYLERKCKDFQNNLINNNIVNYNSQSVDINANDIEIAVKKALSLADEG